MLTDLEQDDKMDRDESVSSYCGLFASAQWFRKCLRHSVYRILHELARAIFRR